LILGILNVTPDSFSDGGRWSHEADAIAHATEMAEQGADIIDVGGESTRPGAERVSAADEQERVLPIVRDLVGRGIRVSVDTMRASTARASARLGAEYINDVSGGLADGDMYRVIAETKVKYIVMHWRGHSDTMQGNAVYTDVVREVRDELTERVTDAVAVGVARASIVIDPGLGFAKTADHNWRLLAGLSELAALGLPILIGASRKRFLAEFAPDDAAPAERDGATAVVSALAAQSGVWGVRVHNVAATRRVLAVWDRWDAGARA
jgi:dihydropteroate synthase